MSDEKNLKVFGIPLKTDPNMPVGQIDIEDNQGRRPLMVNIGCCTKCGLPLINNHECPPSSGIPVRFELPQWPWDNMVPQQPNTITMMPPPPWDELIAGQKIMNGILKAILDILESERELRRKLLNRPPDDEKDREIDF